MPPQEEGMDLPDVSPARVHLLLQGVYGDLSHHNYGLHLYRGDRDDAVWQCCWFWLAAQFSRWYARPPGEVGRRFTEVLAVEWRVLSTGSETLKYLFSLPTLYLPRC